MNETFIQGLTLSAIGLGMVFGALLLLWALIAVLTRLRLPGRVDQAEDNPEVLAELRTAKPAAVPSQDEMAAIAAVLALLRAERDAEIDPAQAPATCPDPLGSCWLRPPITALAATAHPTPRLAIEPRKPLQTTPKRKIDHANVSREKSLTSHLW